MSIIIYNIIIIIYVYLNFWVFGPEAITFIKELGHRIWAETGEPRSLQFLMQDINCSGCPAGQCSCSA